MRIFGFYILTDNQLKEKIELEKTLSKLEFAEVLNTKKDMKFISKTILDLKTKLRCISTSFI